MNHDFAYTNHPIKILLYKPCLMKNNNSNNNIKVASMVSKAPKQGFFFFIILSPFLNVACNKKKIQIQ